ncbi:hypothetical protein EJB05_17199 [Eragrostis curvula]|uniref:MRN complex-interacting protein N-terminal domain-containing protein n=1 Tax=Eragrostis curvula TaxID=38414 RepID=A0A5J9VIS2_9POAL|nr:hypothetical protein EJB05_17199 [Eragrostis curvula]
MPTPSAYQSGKTAPIPHSAASKFKSLSPCSPSPPPSRKPAIAMAPETLFLALKCLQCDTMQVKPQKKSSNRWVCVVCNQRQSVLRIYARGYRAADLRRFVQEANLSRGRRELAPEPEPEWIQTEAAAEEQQDEFPRKKKRTDWSEYLDDPGERGGCGGVEEGAADGDNDIEVVTELPQERSKGRPRKAQFGVSEKRPKPSTHPTLPKRQRIEQGSSPYSLNATAKERPKWSKNLDAYLFGEKNGSENSEQHRTELDECATTEVVVDDEVHPDFM